MISLYKTISEKCSKSITEEYSTSFSSGVKMLGKHLQMPIHAIYGFVRVADEIVDTFHEHNQAALLHEFREETYKAIDRGISTNPVLQSFQWVVNEYGIDREFIDTFLDSMAMDLEKIQYNQALYEKYILGSAQVVGLMCLRVFCEGDKALFERLKGPAMSLGSAFQKVNFLRDINADVNQLGRLYFPNVDLDNLTNQQKRDIEKKLTKNFRTL
jgi:phytoene synthase